MERYGTLRSKYSDLHNNKIKWMFILLMISSVTDGITQGILLLQEKIAQNPLKSSDLDITVISIIASATIIFSLLFTVLYSGKSKKKLLVWGYIIGRFIFLFSFVINYSAVYLVFLFFYHSVFAIQFPVTNSFFPYFFKERSGLYFGIVRSILMFSMMITSLLVGKLLDFNPSMFKWILSIIAVASLLTYGVFYYIESKVDYTELKGTKPVTFKISMTSIFKNTDFIVFEIIFMIYGFAYMISMPTVNLFMLNVLKLSTVEMANAKGIYAQLFIILTMPYAGRIFDRINIWKVGAISFGILILYPLFFILSDVSISKIYAYLGLACYSLGLSGIGILWNLGTIKFSTKENELIYQGFHQTLTGIRGFIGPLLGYYLLLQFGYNLNFYMALILFLIATVWSGGIYIKQKMCRQFKELRK